MQSIVTVYQLIVNCVIVGDTSSRTSIQIRLYIQCSSSSRNHKIDLSSHFHFHCLTTLLNCCSRFLAFKENPNENFIIVVHQFLQLHRIDSNTIRNEPYSISYATPFCYNELWRPTGSDKQRGWKQVRKTRRWPILGFRA